MTDSEDLIQRRGARFSRMTRSSQVVAPKLSMISPFVLELPKQESKLSQKQTKFRFRDTSAIEIDISKSDADSIKKTGDEVSVLGVSRSVSRSLSIMETKTSPMRLAKFSVMTTDEEYSPKAKESITSQMSKGGAEDEAPLVINRLINRMKKMTLLRGLRESMWTASHVAKLLAFLNQSNISLLIIYLNELGDLEVHTEMIKDPMLEFFYFMKRPGTMIVNNDNFLNVINCGTMKPNFYVGFLRHMSNIFSPIVTCNETWPDGIKRDFTAQLNRFMASLTDVRYKMQGETVLFVPPEIEHVPIEVASKNKDIFNGLEGVLLVWINQMKVLVATHSMGTESRDVSGPLSEIDYWRKRCEHISALNKQLQTRRLQKIIEILRLSKSTHLSTFLKLYQQIEEKTCEAESNYEFLLLLEEPCEKLIVSMPSEIPEQLIELILIIRVIWINSPYYNTREKAINLFRKLSVQIIEQCCKAISLDKLLAGHSSESIQILKDCILCCTKWKKEYSDVSRTHNRISNIGWVLDPVSIFAQVDAFIQRCNDLLMVCDCLIHFGRLDNGKREPIAPIFSGQKSSHLYEGMAQVEMAFDRALDRLSQIKEHILDVTASAWHESYSRFYSDMKDLDVLVKNVISTAFETTLTVHDSISLLDAFSHFSHREGIKRVLDKMTAELYTKMHVIMTYVRKEFALKKWSIHPLMPFHAGHAFLSVSLQTHIERPMTLIHNAWWLPVIGMAEEVENQYKTLQNGLSDYMLKTFQEWVASIEGEPRKLLDIPLLCRSHEKQLMLESNFDRNILKICQEVLFWKRLRYQIPTKVADLFEMRDSLKTINEQVLLLVRDYNRIISTLSADELLLFKERISVLDRKLSTALTKLTWTQFNNIDSFFMEIRPIITKTINVVESFKEANANVGQFCKLLSELRFVLIDVRKIYSNQEFEQEQIKHLENLKTKIRQMLVDIESILETNYEIFQNDSAEVKKQWWKYVDRMDLLVESALLIAIRQSLKEVHRTIAGEGKTLPSKLFSVKVVLLDRRIDFQPTVRYLSHLISNLTNTCSAAVAGLTRLTTNLTEQGTSRPDIEILVVNDDEVEKIQLSLNHIMANMTVQLYSYLRVWEPFKDIWEVNKDLFIKKYEKTRPTYATFDADISRYTEIANNVQMQDSLAYLQFVILDCIPLKNSILAHCLEWQRKFTETLHSITMSKLHQIFNYVKSNARRLKIVPETLDDLKELVNLHTTLTNEKDEKEREFVPLQEQFNILGKYEVAISDADHAMLHDLPTQWTFFSNCLYECGEMLKKSKEKFKNILLGSAEELKRHVTHQLDDFQRKAPVYSGIPCATAINLINDLRTQLNEVKTKEEEIRRGLAYFKIDQPTSRELQTLDKDLADLKQIWELTAEWESLWKEVKVIPFDSIRPLVLEDVVNVLFKKINRALRDIKDKNWEIAEITRNMVDTLRKMLPIVTDLKNAAMRERHWEEIKMVINQSFDETAEDFNLGKMFDLSMDQYAEAISEISVAATKELAIEEQLKNITRTWKRVKVEMAPYREKVDMFFVKSTEELITVLEESQTTLGTMKASRYVKPFEALVERWEKNLSMIGEIMEMTIQVQKLWMYLENIFVGEDIRKQIPAESQLFDVINASWKEIMTRIYNNPSALALTEIPGIVETMIKMVSDMEDIQKSLETYMETKRRVFPRFYFISNDDLLEILGNSKNADAIQPHLKKCFDNLVKLKLGKVYVKTVAQGMWSAEGEYVEYPSNLLLDGPVEYWLCDLEDMMRICLRDLLNQCRQALKKNLKKRDKWMKEWPGQLCITSNQIQWTTDVSRALTQTKEIGDKLPLKSLKKKQVAMLNKFTEAIRGNLTKLQRLKVAAIVTIEVHARDVIEKLMRSRTYDINGFEWLSQLRFYWENNDCMTRMTNTQFPYRYEYLGNSGRLVVTPLTDRCYITLTTALHLHRGGSPLGPAGTGKTETCKDLGKALAMYVIVINCSDGLDYIQMGKMFSGLAQAGVWVCYDEFNRITIEVLSVVAQQVICVLSALSAGVKKFVFQGEEIPLLWYCSFFITMNPGYAGRTELPENLKAMFRPIAMCVPDNALISEILLYGEGFDNTRLLSKKMTTLFSLAMQQLSKQDHYEFGLRGLVAVLRHAGRKRRQNPHLPHEEIALLSMKDMNYPKLPAIDIPLFNGIISDLFPGIEVSQIDYSVMNKAIEQELLSRNLQVIPNAFTKVIQLYETKQSRHSSMVVGNTLSSKTITWTILQGIMNRLCKQGEPGFNIVKDLPLNPKAMTLGELYGEFNALGEWMDGVLSSMIRQACADEKPDEKWILFDGPVDTLWIETMNSLMDDNKVLTLINGERIALADQVSLLFECQDLSVASPATTSRVGIVYFDYANIGWRPYMNSWLNTLKKPYADELRKNFESYVLNLLEFKEVHCRELVRIHEMNGVISLCRILEMIVTEENGIIPEDESFQTMVRLLFVYACLWSICASVTDEGRQKIDSYIRENESTIPNKDSVYEYFVDTKLKMWVHWEEKLPRDWKVNPNLPFFKIMVPTIDTVRYNYIVSLLLKKNNPVLIVGPVGTGKTSIALNVMNDFYLKDYRIMTINLSAQSSSKNVQDTIESKLEKKTKGVFVPIGNKKMITFLDDLNMPAKDEFGSQPPLELIKTWIDFGFWFDLQKQVPKVVKLMILLAAMGPPGGGRTEISKRLQSFFSLINVPFPAESQVKRIYGMMITQKLIDFDEEVKGLASNLNQATIDMFHLVVGRMLPTPARIHYLFNLRDISKVFQGLLRANSSIHDSVPSMIRLWIHECFRVFADRLIDDKDVNTFIAMLTERLANVFNQTYHNICPNRQPPIFVDFMHPDLFYTDCRDFQTLKKYIEGEISNYNSTPGKVPMSLVPFRDAVEHLSHIIRVVRQPKGNMLLIGIGGIGKQSLTKLSAFICSFVLFQIEVKKNYRKNEFREDMKSLYSITGLDNKPAIFLFLDSQVAEESFLEDINNILSSGEVPTLYKPDELDAIKINLDAAARVAGVVTEDPEAMTQFFFDRIRGNLHVVLAMSPIGEPFRNRMRMYPALVNCTTIDWFSDWPQDALLEVGERFLLGVNLDGGDEKRSSIAYIFSLMHKSVGDYCKRMLLELKRYNYITPMHYLELVAGYKRLLNNKRGELTNSADKLRNGLFKLDDTRSKVEIMSEELEDAKIKVAEFQKQCDEYLIIIVQQKRDADEQAKSVTARSEKIAEEEVKCKKMADMALADLQVVMPALDEAVKALESLNKKDLTEIKSYGRPPPAVERVMEAVMILKGADANWAEAKRQLGEPNFIKQLMFFDKDNIPDKVLKKIGGYCADPEFQPEIIGKVSLAAKSLCMWVRAMEVYGRVFRVVLPKRQRLMAAEQELEDKQRILSEAKAKLDELMAQVEDLKRQYEEKLQVKEELRSKAENLVIKMDRAEKLVEGLGGEKSRWEETVKLLDKKISFVVGDCLIAAGFLSYLGPFLSVYREELIKRWLKELKIRTISSDPEFKMGLFLAKPTHIRAWNQQGLPSDEFSTENGIMVTLGNRWPLMIDPQGQAQKWIKNMEGKLLKIIDLEQPDYLRVLEHCIAEGLPVLLQNVKEDLESSLNPILNKDIFIISGLPIIKVGDKEITYNYNFRFYITTKLGNPHYTPEVSSKVTLVNFSVKQQGLENQLLAMVVRKERPELETMKDSLVTNISNGKQKLLELEDTILRMLSEAKGSLLDNETLVTTLQSSKKISVEVNEQLEIAQETEINIDTAREAYRSCAERASVLFFVLNDMSLIDPMYQFSLDSYTDLFTNSIEKSPKSNVLEDRISNINDYHTYATYRYTCRGLFERHKLLFSFHMCSKILEVTGKINQEEFSFFLRGGLCLDRSGQVENPCPTWVTELMWDNITELEKLANFHGVIQSFEQFPKDWQIWYTSPEPENTTLPGDWQHTCNELQRMLFVRCLRPDRVSFCATSFVVNNLGARFVEPPILDMNAVLDDSSCKNPLVFVLSPGVDPTAALLQLAENKNMQNRFNFLSLGQGQSPIATKLIMSGRLTGNWVFLANCHLCISWMPELEKIVQNLAAEEPHFNFRLWLSSSPHPDFPISVLQAGIKMTTEPPKGIKTNMKRLYTLVPETNFYNSRRPQKYKKLLFALCFFHSLLLERRKFQMLGWNVSYGFNDADFEVCENLLNIYIDEYEDTPWDALKYLIAGVMYGGHVTDTWDMRLLFTYANQFFCEEAIATPYFKLSVLPYYYIPRDGNIESYRDFINTLPPTDHPEAFGQHPNADIASQINETELLFATLLSMQVQTTVAVGESKEVKVSRLGMDFLSKMPPTMDYEGTSRTLAGDPSPFNVVLLQEMERYNNLLNSIRSSLIDLEKSIQGIVVMSAKLEEIFNCIYDGKVPPAWLKAYPSMKNLGSWTRDLLLRVEQLATWARNARPPILFWLAGFTFPTGFLTAALQATARLYNIPIDTLGWEFTVSTLEDAQILAPPQEGVLIRGLFLEGAAWDKKFSCLTDAAPMQLVSTLPVIHFRPVETKKKSTKGLYICPAYYFPNRSGSGGRLSFVCSIDLKAGGMPADHWVKRGTAILLSLAI